MEEKRKPVYAAKIELRKKLWGKMCAILEGGQVTIAFDCGSRTPNSPTTHHPHHPHWNTTQAENLRLISAMKEKLKVRLVDPRTTLSHTCQNKRVARPFQKAARLSVISAKAVGLSVWGKQ